jgi:hypothetical protein
MDRSQSQVLQWARRVRDFLAEYGIKSDLAELATIKQQLDDTIGQLTVNAASQEAITKQSRVQTTEIWRLRNDLREGHLKPIVRMSRTMKLQINGSDITFVLPDNRENNERLAAAGDAMVTALNVVGKEFVARGFAANFVEQLSSATKALRDAIDQRSAQLSRRTGTTAAMASQGDHALKLVRLIDTLVRPVVQSDPVLLSAWESVVALPRQSASGGVVAATPVTSTTPATPATATTPSSVIGAAGQAPQAAA